MNNFYNIQSREDLSILLNISLRKLTYVLYKKGTHNFYDTFQIPKKNGGTRTINAPHGLLKYIQKQLSLVLNEYNSEIDISQNTVSHAFEKNKSIITNAKIHKNKKIVLNIDLEDYFTCFNFGRVRGYFEKNKNFQLPREVATVIAQLTCFNGSLPQGAPSSPIITNMISKILDYHILKITKKYRLDYSRYADDLTFSTNDKRFLINKDNFLFELEREITKSGFKVNSNKTRFSYYNSRQEVTGLIVNKKININKEYYKTTRAMLNSLYKRGYFIINNTYGAIHQVEGRLSFINQIEKYNNILEGKHKKVTQFNSKEKDYLYFLFYKYFFQNDRPLIITEGKTDVVYLRAALKKLYIKYPNLINKEDSSFSYNLSFFNRTKRTEYFFNLQLDGGDTLINILNMYRGINQYKNIYNYFKTICSSIPKYPVIIILDNEQKNKKPLKKFKDHANLKFDFSSKLYYNLEGNLYLLTIPLIDNKEEVEIEDLFDNETLSTLKNGKSFSRESNYDKKLHYGKFIFSQHISQNYEQIDFSNFKPLLSSIDNIIEEYDNIYNNYKKQNAHKD